MLTLTHLERLLPEQATPRVRQKPRHTLLGLALEAFRTGQSKNCCAPLRRLTPTKHTAGPLAKMSQAVGKTALPDRISINDSKHD